jgi:hypothetical protein
MCRRFQQFSEFRMDDGEVLGQCRECTASLAEGMDQRLLRRYGITALEYGAMLTGQGYKCAVCRNYMHAYNVPQVDHCHATGRARGLLCRRCNTSMGMFKDDPVLMQAAVDYLKEHKKKEEEA